MPPDADEDARRERVRAALREVIDPEVGLDVVTMGLVYRIDVDGPTVRIRHTLTTPGCPMEGVLEKGIADAGRARRTGRATSGSAGAPQGGPRERES